MISVLLVFPSAHLYLLNPCGQQGNMTSAAEGKGCSISLPSIAMVLTIIQLIPRWNIPERTSKL